MRLRGVIVAGLLVAAIGVSVACTKDPPGEVVLSFQTDMSVPKDVSAVVLSITSSGRTLFEEQYAVGPTGVKLPSTFGVLEGEKDEPVTVRLIALKGTRPVVLREVVMKIPKGRVAGMRMPIEWLCSGESSVKGEIRQAAENQCPAGQTCSAGSCVPSDSFPLDDPYDARSVFGGGDDKGQGGSCFSTESCFSAVQTVNVTPADDGSACAFTLDGVKNVALEPEDRATGIATGPNGTGPFLIPLDQGKTGFELQGSRVTLPRAVCARTSKGLRVYATRSCSPKTNRNPTCGAWSAVTKAAPDSDGGTSAEGGGPGWKAVPLDSPPAALRVVGTPNERRIYFMMREGSGTKVVSCNAGDCSAASLRCEAKFSAELRGMTVQQTSPTDAPTAIYGLTGPTTVEVVSPLGTCNASTPVAFPEAPPQIFDIGAAPTELLLLGEDRLASCNTSDVRRCQIQRVKDLSPAVPPIGRLDVGASVAYIHGTKVGGCKTSACSPAESSERDVSGPPDNAGPPLAIVALRDNYFWIDQRGPNMTVRDCPNAGPCGGLDLTREGTFLSLATTDRFLYLGAPDGLYRAARPSVPPGPPPLPTQVEQADTVLDVHAEGQNVYYLTPKGLFRFIDPGN